MARASLTHGGFYAHFASKDDLVSETVEMMVDQVVTRYERTIRDLAPREALRAYIEWYLSPKHRDNTSSICPLPVITSEVSRMGEQPQKSYERGLESLISGLAKLSLAVGIADAECVASSVAAELVGGISLARAVADRSKSDRILERSKRSVLSRLGLSSDAALEMTSGCLASGQS